MYTSTKVEIIHHQQICIKINVKGNSGRRRRLRGRKESRRGREGTTEGQLEDLSGEAEKEFLHSTLMFTSLTYSLLVLRLPLTSDQYHFHQHPVFCSCPFFRRVLHLFLDLFPLLFAPKSLVSTPKDLRLPPWFLSVSRGLDTWPL